MGRPTNLGRGIEREGPREHDRNRMTLTEFLNHHGLAENPFRAEEARSDAVFARMTAATPGAAPAPAPGQELGAYHSDFEKFLGDIAKPATAILFGEKGSGKTAIKMQIASRVSAHNLAHPGGKVLLIAYDDLNAFLGRLHEKAGGKTPLESFQTLRLVDHIDAVLLTLVPRLVDSLLETPQDDGVIELGADPRRAARRLDPASKRDLLLLQAVYDRPEHADLRTPQLRARLGIWMPWSRFLINALLWLGPIALLALGAWGRWYSPESIRTDASGAAFAGLCTIYLIALGKFVGWDTFQRLRLGRRLKKQIRVSGRSHTSYARSLAKLDLAAQGLGELPTTDSDEPRYAMLARTRRVLANFGYSGLLIAVDRVDEPTLVSGDPDRMRAIVWPLLNNKFLQQEGIGVKLLLPVELRHLLFKESSAFFQDARLDKQSLVERLTWTGPMLYDLCDARLRACRPAGAPPIQLLDLFAEDVTRQDMVDALDQMHQPRDAFKFLYRCMTEHAAGVTLDQNAWRIPRLTLDQIKKQEVDRIQQLHRGIRPA